MAVRVGTTWSAPRPVTGGCPHGSILGIFIFNATTGDLEDGFLEAEREEVEDDYDVLPDTDGAWARPEPSSPEEARPPTSSTPPSGHPDPETIEDTPPITAGRQF